MGILPHHTRWAQFFENLELIVIDEMLLPRRVRLARSQRHPSPEKVRTIFMELDRNFCLASATIANPHQLAERLTGESIHLIDQDGSARGDRHFLIYNPPIIDQVTGLRSSIIQESEPGWQMTC